MVFRKKGTPPRIVPANAQWAAFTEALAQLEKPTACAGDARFTSEDSTERAEAAALCTGCPVLDLCAAAARSTREGHVYGGKDRTREAKRGAA